MTGLFNNPRRHLRKLVKQKKYDEALEYGHEIEKGFEHDPDIAFIIGTIYYIKGDATKTIEYMDRTLDIGEYDLDALAIKASVFLNLKDKEKVIQCCEKIKELDPKNKSLLEIEEELKENALKLMEEGYTAFKMSPFPAGVEGNKHFSPSDYRASKQYYVPVWQNLPWNDVIRLSSERLAAVRDAVGNGPEIAIDIHAVFRDAVKANQLVRELSQYRLLFYEEPVTPHNLTTTARLRGELNAPLATGECLYSIQTFAQLMELGAVDIIQPDVLICGGILEMKKVTYSSPLRVTACCIMRSSDSFVFFIFPQAIMSFSCFGKRRRT